MQNVNVWFMHFLIAWKLVESDSNYYTNKHCKKDTVIQCAIHAMEIKMYIYVISTSIQ